MIRWFGVARVMSVNRMQILEFDRTQLRSAGVPIGWSKATRNASFSSRSPGRNVGWMSVVRSSGKSTSTRP
jgi:hypothetical protein